ncbi:MAG TPA: DNA methylase [Mycobacterium sp.]|nr:DNA methylase [Mycobacterium sp.]
MPFLLDLYCGAGGAARGYSQAGWDVIGVDNQPQPNYPFVMIQGDAVEYLRNLLKWLAVRSSPFAAVHASPPCQRWSKMSACRPRLRDEYPDLIGPTRELLERTGLPYVIENVPGAPLRDPAVLCATMFGREELFRHRLFETNWPLIVPEHLPHLLPSSRAGHWRPGTAMSISGHIAPVAKARELMAIDWTTRDELAEAIPPYYSEFVGLQLLAAVERGAA